MKRLHSHKSFKSRLRVALIGLVATAGMLVVASGADAAVTEAPEITSTPTNPQTTSVNVEFKYTVGEGETSTVTPLLFFCRTYPTATPPAAGAGWAACGLSTGAQPLTKTYPALANGSLTFEVAVRETANLLTQGPIASFEWNQNVPLPLLPPVIVSEPDDPNTTLPSTFTFAAGSGESNVVDRFQCRIDSTEESDWTNCSAGTQEYNLENGEHNFEVRAGNVNGYGPSSDPVTWTVDVPIPEPSISLEDSSITRWDGVVASGQIGDWIGQSGASTAGVQNIGDVNGDGLNDLAVSTTGTSGTNSGIYVIYGDENGKGIRSLASLSADDGFKIQPRTDTAMSNAVRNFRNVGDQNGDGVPDLLIAAGGIGNAINQTLQNYVVYGGIDASELGNCSGSTVVRCFNLVDISDEEGYILMSPNSARVSFNGSLGNAGDYDGDGIDDLVFGSGATHNHDYLVKGGVRTGSTDITTMPNTEVQKFVGSGIVTNLGGGVTGVGDLNGDGFDDVYLGTYSAGGGKIFFGREFGEEPINVFDFDADDGIWLPLAAVSDFAIENVGDINGDGRPDLATSEAIGNLNPPDLMSVLYLPELPTSDPLLGGGDLAPGSGYLVEPGGLPSQLGAIMDNVGDFNNDEIPDMITTAAETPVDGLPNTGAAYVLFGQRPGPEVPAQIGPELSPELGVALLGENENDRAGSSVTSLGDWDGDGLTDFAVGAGGTDPNGISYAGSVYFVPGKALINQVKTGNAVGVGNYSAALNAGLSTNNRDAEVLFEYGTTDEYGDSTDPQEFDGSNTGDAASVAIDGLAKNTTYHYRAVATNDLGLTRYGDDKTFTTTNTDDPGPSNPCTTDPKALGCPDYPYCEVNPGMCNTVGPAKLTLITSPKSLKVKRGKKGSVSAIVINAGGKAASGVKVCVKAPKKFVKVKKCQTIGSLGSGATKTKTIKVTVKKSAKKGKKIALKFTASGAGIGSKKATAKVVVR